MNVADRASSGAEAKVELDIFSGRPNPAWTLSASQRDELLRLLRIERPKVAGPALPGLGYRGLTVRVQQGRKTDVFHVSDGAIEIDRGHRADTGNAIERFLLKTMPAELKTQFSTIIPALPD